MSNVAKTRQETRPTAVANCSVQSSVHFPCPVTFFQPSPFLFPGEDGLGHGKKEEEKKGGYTKISSTELTLALAHHSLGREG